jgi:hypothetical protein
MPVVLSIILLKDALCDLVIVRLPPLTVELNRIAYEPETDGSSTSIL